MIDIIEKPAQYIGNLASVLYFKVNSEVVASAQHISISERGEYELITPIQEFAKHHEFRVHKLRYPFLDITSVADLENANLNILNLEKPRFGESILLEVFGEDYELHV
jgi:dTDP-glucose pyrophosphorylase